jgi:death-on-curing protein
VTLLWITREVALAAHTKSLLDHGGAEGVRDEGMLESALSRPQNLAAHGEPSIYDLASALGYDLAKNHPFVDGNKRTALLCVYVFLGLNGHELDADEAEAAAITVDLAAGAVSEADFSLWLKANCRPV